MFYNLNDAYDVLHCESEKSTTFLQGQLTCDVNACQDRQVHLGALCNAQGRVCSHLWLWRTEQGYCLVVPKTLSMQCLQALGLAARLSRIALQKKTTNLWAGPAAAKPIGWRYLPFADLWQGHGFYVHENLEKILPEEQKTIYWHHTLLQKGLIEMQPQTLHHFTPHMLHYPMLNMVSFNKGCYLGQEIIARTHYLGKTKRSAQWAVMDTAQALVPGMRLEANDTTVLGEIAHCLTVDGQTCLTVVGTAQMAGTQTITPHGTLTWQNPP